MTRLCPLSVLPLLTVLSLPACGGSAEDVAGEGDGDTSGDGDGDGDMSPGDGDDSPGDGDGDGDNQCSAFDDDDPGGLEVFIRNERSTPIFLGARESTCGTVPMFELYDSAGTELYPDTASNCVGSCEDYANGDVFACPAICLYPELIRVDPGSSHLVLWDTRYVDNGEIPAECNPLDDILFSCFVRRAVQPGTFTFRATAGTEAHCGDLGCNDCDPESEECVGEVLVGGEELEAEVTVELDASFGIYAEGDATSPGGGAIYPVEIFFTELDQ